MLKHTNKLTNLFFILIIWILLMMSVVAFGQNVGINNLTPDASALLDLTSTSKGLLIPRMTTAQRVAIATPATGLLVFDSTLNEFWFYDGTAWRKIQIKILFLEM
ncbi:MAG: hypothetical protein IPP71_02600 [Bacteroidetes bacterium]|nr:hypothetical protein [Bacteroidota bacterium]